jgi:hypothetical protein
MDSRRPNLFVELSTTFIITIASAQAIEEKVMEGAENMLKAYKNVDVPAPDREALRTQAMLVDMRALVLSLTASQQRLSPNCFPSPIE